MKEILITLRDMFHYVKGKNRFLVHAECTIEGIEYTIEKDVIKNTAIVLTYYPPLKRASIKYVDSSFDIFGGHLPKMKTITKRDFNMAFMQFLLGITNIAPFENEDQTAN